VGFTGKADIAAWVGSRWIWLITAIGSHLLVGWMSSPLLMLWQGDAPASRPWEQGISYDRNGLRQHYLSHRCLSRVFKKQSDDNTGVVSMV
jgi:hypothetical protein